MAWVAPAADGSVFDHKSLFRGLPKTTGTVKEAAKKAGAILDAVRGIKHTFRVFRHGFQAGLATAALGGVAWLVWRHRRINRDYEEFVSRVQPLFVDDADDAFEELDAAPGDVGFDRVEEVGCEEDGSGSDAGARATGGRRQARRKKLVATPYEGGVLKGAYLAQLVAEVRGCSYAGAYSPANADIVRSHLRRKLIEHGVRPSHIQRHLSNMVLAVFYKSADDRAEERGLAAARARGRLRGSRTLDF